MDFAHQAFHELHVQGMAGRIHVQTGHDLSALVGHLTHFLGRQPPLPEWVQSGAILGIQGGTKMVRDRIHLVWKKKLLTAKGYVGAEHKLQSISELFIPQVIKPQLSLSLSLKPQL